MVGQLARLALAGVAGLGGALLARGLRQSFSPYSFAGKTVLLTGGSRGLGFALAEKLIAYEDIKLVICGRDELRLQKAAQLLAPLAKGRLTPVACDITDEVQVDAMLAQITRSCGPIDVLINNAGQIAVGPLASMSKSDFAAMLSVHLWGPLFLTKAVIPMMRKKGAGRIVNITSVGGKIAVPHMVPYSVSKFASVGLSEGLHAELKRDGILVTTVVPGLMRTGSPRQAQFKGQAEAEYRWFTISDSLPFLSVSADEAAEKILAACRRGDAVLNLSWPSKLASLGQGLAPGLVAEIGAFVNRLLPQADPAQNGKVKKGAEAESPATRSFVTGMTRWAEKRYNQLP